jgi:hypothetical protein
MEWCLQDVLSIVRELLDKFDGVCMATALYWIAKLGGGRVDMERSEIQNLQRAIGESSVVIHWNPSHLEVLLKMYNLDFEVPCALH